MNYVGKHEKKQYQPRIAIERKKLAYLMLSAFLAGVITGSIATKAYICPPEDTSAMAVECVVESDSDIKPVTHESAKSSHNAFIGHTEGVLEHFAAKGNKSPAQEVDIYDLYSEDDIMAVTNMVYGEISVIIYDQNMTDEQKDLAMQEWARVPVNHLSLGIADNCVDLMSARSGSYYIWHPQYGTSWYRDRAMQTDPDRYSRCRENVEIALAGRMSEPMPDNVIYADLAVHGSGAYKSYTINTGYFTSTVYLSYK